MNPELPLEEHQADICVVGGGMAGLIAAVSAARRGSSVILVHDRPVLGGNASSEVRMWICGAHGANMKETGLLEEIQLRNRRRNPQGLYNAWDSVLFEYAKMTPGLTTFLNCTCNNGIMENGQLRSIDAWEMPSQTWRRITAKLFIDCSGDSILAPLSGAETRTGREAREEFNESLAPLRSDLKTMGNTILMQLEETPEPQPFSPPNWAYYFGDDSNLPSRLGSGLGNNFWWLELGGLKDTIADSENIRDELIKVTWGVWDYMKNRGPQAEKLTNWRLRWMGALPGKRENRRYMGEHVLTQNDISAEGKFDDIVAYGGWSMDDHHPAGLYYPGKPTLFHHAPSPYGIPFRSLYSRNVPNLLCAGRNISATHCAMSSTRVMATCSIMGQAVGTAAALCATKSVLPRDIKGQLLSELQRQLTEDDCWLPGHAKPLPEAMNSASITASNGAATDALRDGHERIIQGEDHAWEGAAGDSISIEWSAATDIDCVRLVFDSDLNDPKKMPVLYPHGRALETMPKQLVKAFRIEAQTADGQWETLHTTEDNQRRLVVLPVKQSVRALRFTGDAAWGDSPIRVFSFEASSVAIPLSTDPADGKSWREVMDSINPDDMKEPDHGLENASRGQSRVGA
ncbi:FAD-dependent oxidoreductase [Cerasicoccus fimbriatus]|uniref:FAD-dependent oxidoreductase n=1 Tax=Cerasicoccus fimbriatus TaxID=3014554 RepID=UPI0022B2C19A|nr:FAD-dependent oxidoreductase [Cerasicoccus sp. TK19100]